MAQGEIDLDQETGSNRTTSKFEESKTISQAAAQLV